MLLFCFCLLEFPENLAYSNGGVIGSYIISAFRNCLSIDIPHVLSIDCELGCNIWIATTTIDYHTIYLYSILNASIQWRPRDSWVITHSGDRSRRGFWRCKLNLFPLPQFTSIFLVCYNSQWSSKSPVPRPSCWALVLVWHPMFGDV